ncbi:ATP-binding cassette domain-containing protein [Streptomyces sp. AJS327]|uniref:ATP-binding cassette domain-containing protein n=1 Tax=Streptomyces sp. AJS327 TaxID=2545265 RepID=UPI0015DEBEB1|nr:ATP-binding cassette domain-containing protein [Streptomyces sp. AJS327]MBA0051978.1 ATP-binding cassette domain-containing protein [Streptomyces sp. AJS327]
MIQAIGITSVRRRQRPLAVDDLTFEAHPGRITVLHGPSGAGKTSALRLMLQLRSGRGTALFRGRPMSRIRHPHREVGVLLGDVAGHPGRTVRGHMRMLGPVVGVPPVRAEEVLDVVGLNGLADHRLGGFSLGMGRRLGVAVALLGDPHTLVLDEPADGLSGRETSWLHGLLRSFAGQGGTVLMTCPDPEEAARFGDHVLSLTQGRLVADESVSDFARARLRRVVVAHSPEARRLASVLPQGGEVPVVGDEFRRVRVSEDGFRVSVFDSDCATVGRMAHHHGIPLHRLSEEPGFAPSALRESTATVASARQLGVRPPRSAPVTSAAQPVILPAGRAGSGGSPIGAHAVAPLTATDPSVPTPSARSAAAPLSGPSRFPEPTPFAEGEPGEAVTDPAGTGAEHTGEDGGEPTQSLPAPLPAVPRPGPVAPLRYELRRLLGLRATWLVLAGAVLASFTVALVTAAAGTPGSGGAGVPLSPAVRLLTGWPATGVVLLPPAVLAAGWLGALAFGQEFRYPALAPLAGWSRLLLAKSLVSAVVASLLAAGTALVNGSALVVLFGPGALAPRSGGPGWLVEWAAVVLLGIGCSWCALLAAAVFRASWAGALAVLSVPLLAATAEGPLGALASALCEVLDGAGLVISSLGAAGPAAWLEKAAEGVSQPFAGALLLVLVTLWCGFLCALPRRGRP